jgi:hypothetical protein
MASTPGSDEKVRGQIAGIIVLWGPLTVLVLGGLMIGLATDKSQAAQTVLSSVLPLLGTWVGTVLAFYFAKENFEAASKSTRDLLGLDERLRSIPVREAMIPVAKADTFNLTAGAKPEEIKLSVLVQAMRDKQRNRLPVLSQGGAAVFVIHLSTLTEFLAEQPDTAAGGGPAKADLTIGDLRKKAEKLYLKLLAWACVKAGASLAEAKAVMESKPDCSDVFVTESGKSEEAVLGWVTNVEMGLRSRT